MEIEAGAAPNETRPVPAAIAAYVEAATPRLRGATLVTYGVAIGTFESWCKRNGVETTGDITRARLAAFRDSLIAKPKLSAAKGGRRGVVLAAEDRRRSPVSVNRELRTTKTLLNVWRQSGLVRLTRDDIADTLKALPTPREQAEFLAPAQLQRLLEATVRHDSVVFDETRKEHRGLLPKGSTRRYEPIGRERAVDGRTGCAEGGQTRRSR